MLIDFTESDNEMIKIEATAAVACGDFSDWDHAYETLWDTFEHELAEQTNEQQDI
jgi:hypothetical protein